MTVTRLLPAKSAVTGSGRPAWRWRRHAPGRGGRAQRHPGVVDGQARGGHCRAVAAQSLARGVDARLVTDEADPAMAVRDEVGHRVLGAAEVVGDHDVRVDPAGRAVHEDGGYPGRDLRLQIAVVVGGRDDDQPVHPPCAQREHQLLFAVRVLGAGAVDQQRAVVAGDFLDSAVERTVEGVGEILQHQTDAGRTPLAQDPGGVVTAEPQGGDGFLDASFGVRGDPGSPLTTRETVLRPTPARAATSFIVGRVP